MKKFLTIYILLFVIFFGITIFQNAANAKLGDWQSKLDAGASESYNTGEASPSIPRYLGRLYKWIPMLGITFIIQIVLAGYEWMTAGGEAAKVEDARKRILHAVIGISILLGLYVISYFLIDRLIFITGF
ncbi:MAG: hypothetical protein UT48_C0029G0010 [Parcubacteria group bacterium GW2011_GWE2_39_37]|uniref:Uncharacterized protein n=1 Tax=Candidatus Falkowbacteria bacterium GW2011_GWF2_39_8 TaxID=1618642 RepID=A0A0G0SGW5_9BACT|nr:MAG: hypothetical protein UT48_C0029G0010 [Parcubacteria group bacterium GW2011_GWE2_39_37]KKR33945.1 MAG: hypothetical protein UT64_C0001G0019 [Candidatus Falkowbacteria bacterium GW2011_GWF2_39_8]